MSSSALLHLGAMFSFFSRSRPITATINGRSIKVLPKETILTAALRNGVTFPYSCKVGGCATCKCKLLNGTVKELTNASYILSEEELRSGYILACQSVPRGDVLIEVDDTATSAARRSTGEAVSPSSRSSCSALPSRSTSPSRRTPTSRMRARWRRRAA